VASIQWFVGNVLYPGLPATTRFLETVLAAVADLFPGPVIHLGGDEVPEGCWAGSPVVDDYTRRRGLPSPRDVERSFLADAAAIVRSLGREPAVWQEGADALEPGEGLVMAWKTHADVASLAAAGHRVIACPAAHWYLDMATDRRWATRGASWAGHISDDLAARAELGIADDHPARRNVVGAQACLWTEHVPTPALVDTHLRPRLDLLAGSLWDAAPSDVE
jgi:hexosaminidase